MHMPGYDFLVKDPTFAAVFAPNGTLLNEGDTMYRRTYAQTLDTIVSLLNGLKLMEGDLWD